MRPSRRAPDELRPVTLERGVVEYAEGSCMVKFGDTQVLRHRHPGGAAAALAEGPGPRLGHRRIRHAAARHRCERTRREAAAGKQGGRTQSRSSA